MLGRFAEQTKPVLLGDAVDEGAQNSGTGTLDLLVLVLVVVVDVVVEREEEEWWASSSLLAVV